MLLTTEKCFFFMAQVLGFSDVIKSYVLEDTTVHLGVHLGFYGVQKSQNQLQSEILLFLSNYTIKRIFSGVSPPPPDPPNWKFFSP